MNLALGETTVESMLNNKTSMQTVFQNESHKPFEKVKQQSITKDSDRIIIHYILNFKDLCLIALSCPLFTILTCLITGFIFQPNDIHETHCRVYNLIPSISAITGISPQKYLWRVCVAFHLGPRLLMAAVARAYNLNLIEGTRTNEQEKAKKWIDYTFWFQLIEICCLAGVTYISNRENYPAHEKLFITFVVSSILHMWASIKSTMIVSQINGTVGKMSKKVQIKKKLLSVSIASIFGIIGFFLQHRYLCHNMAFSWFALCEYIFAIANIVFHYVTALDFSEEVLMIGKGLTKSSLQNPKTD